MPVYVAAVRLVSFQFTPSYTNDTVNTTPDTVPVDRVPVDLNAVPHVRVYDVVPAVVTTNVHVAPATPPLALNVQAAVGVIVITGVVMLTVIAPVVAGVAAPPVAGVSSDSNLSNRL